MAPGRSAPVKSTISRMSSKAGLGESPLSCYVAFLMSRGKLDQQSGAASGRCVHMRAVSGPPFMPAPQFVSPLFIRSSREPVSMMARNSLRKSG